VIEWLPAESGEVVEVVNVAVPVELSIAVPSIVVPSMNVTVPVGVSIACGIDGLTVAVNVTV
jgi:hypothetical protein